MHPQERAAGNVLAAGALGVVLGPSGLVGKAQPFSWGVTAVTDLSGCPVTAGYLEKAPKLGFESSQVFIGRATWAWLWILPRSTNPSKLCCLEAKCSFKIQTSYLYLNSNFCTVNKFVYPSNSHSVGLNYFRESPKRESLTPRSYLLGRPSFKDRKIFPVTMTLTLLPTMIP